SGPVAVGSGRRRRRGAPRCPLRGGRFRRVKAFPLRVRRVWTQRFLFGCASRPVQRGALPGSGVTADEKSTSGVGEACEWTGQKPWEEHGAPPHLNMSGRGGHTARPGTSHRKSRCCRPVQAFSQLISGRSSAPTFSICWFCPASRRFLKVG